MKSLGTVSDRVERDYSFMEDWTLAEVEAHVEADSQASDRLRYESKIERWRQTDPEAAAKFDQRHASASGTP